ncbi:MAG: bifunctional phosphoribosylaminoimidazolecarboxamide formyltransferase/IMP cyclohydrolase [Polyangiales bacterium]
MPVIRRALVSVSDKRDLIPFLKSLTDRGVEVLSTGGTARALRDASVPVTDVSAYTGSPEIMDGRVKTLHPKVHGAILMRERDDDREALASIGGAPIDLVVVNLYPFEETLRRAGASHDELVEKIDIGGPAMVRAAAKNHARVTVVVDPGDYAEVLREIDRDGGVTHATRVALASKAFAHTAAYDGSIAGYLSALDEDGVVEPHPRALHLSYERQYTLRYGENPHQSAAFYRERDAAEGTLGRAKSVGAGGKELSFNNLVDVDSALDAVREFSAPAAVVVKHTNPCGVATAASLAAAYRLARAADSLSAFGGIVALNRAVDLETASVLVETFLEAVVAPSFEPDALAALHTKKNLRLIEIGAFSPSASPVRTSRAVSGGLLVQDVDRHRGGEVEAARVVTRRAPSRDELDALAFAWLVAKHVKSNAIVLARGDATGCRTVGVGAGQMSRVVSVDIACQKAGDEARGAVLGSDAFFPFPDGVERAAAAGVRAVVQPGGSVRDAEVIAAADAHDIAMLFTDVRHFRH